MATSTFPTAQAGLQIVTQYEGTKTLNRRAPPEVCGYVGGRSEIPLACPYGTTCAYDNKFEVAGCCSQVPCNVYSVCFDYADPLCANPYQFGIGTGCCNVVNPYCVTLTYSDIAGSVLWCVPAPVTTDVAMFAQALTSPVITVPVSESWGTPDLVPGKSTQTSEADPAKPTSTGKGGGLSLSDKIALGVGIGFGVPSTIAAVWVCLCR